MTEISTAMETFAAILGAGLKERGFRRKGRWFERPRGDGADVVYLQGARRNRSARFFPDSDAAHAYINLYAWWPELQSSATTQKMTNVSTRVVGNDQGSWDFTAATAATAAERALAVIDAVGEEWWAAQTRPGAK